MSTNTFARRRKLPDEAQDAIRDFQLRPSYEGGTMRRAARTDDNQAAIVAALRSVGATVQPLHQIGAGCPDILVGWRGANYLMEIKDGNKPPSRRRLTSAENAFHALWGGHVTIVESETDALKEIGAI